MNDEKKNVENSNIKGESTKHLKKEKIKKRKAFIDMKVREARENFEKARRDLLKIQNKSLKEDIFIEEYEKQKNRIGQLGGHNKVVQGHYNQMEGNMPTETTNRIMNIEIMKGHARVQDRNHQMFNGPANGQMFLVSQFAAEQHGNGNPFSSYNQAGSSVMQSNPGKQPYVVNISSDEETESDKDRVE
uniref:Uncharacterized protein n=1 Tax=Meloidogyne enterolobii TaxID=390850 RepID=A0A6V7XUA1_MELEN|nr:unnamed protein product [Meloidogyne enterolobii]